MLNTDIWPLGQQMDKFDELFKLKLRVSFLFIDNWSLVMIKPLQKKYKEDVFKGEIIPKIDFFVSLLEKPFGDMDKPEAKTDNNKENSAIIGKK